MFSLAVKSFALSAAGIAALLTDCGAGTAASAQTSVMAPSLPSAEEFVHGIGLRIRLTVRAASVGAFEDPGFSVVFENVSRTPIYLSPLIVPNLYIYDDRGTLVTPTSGGIAESPLLVVTKSQLVHLRPGGTWSAPVRPQHHPNEMGAWLSYVVYRRQDQHERFALRGGRYTARFVYLNYPGFPAFYDPYEIRNVWEGRQEAEPVSFLVAPGAEQEIETVERETRLARQRSPELMATIAELEQQLTSDERNKVAAAASQLRRLESTGSVTALLPLLKDRRSWKRYIGVITLPTLGGERLRDPMMALVDDPDPNVRSYALLHIGNYCELKDLPLFEVRLDRTLSEGVMYGIGLCGNTASFAKLRPLLESGDANVRRRAEHALRLLTFTELTFNEVPSPAKPGDWDTWYREHRRESRERWALRRLREVKRATCPRHSATVALDYLRRLKDPRLLPEFRRAASSDVYTVRVAASRAIVEFDRNEGLALLRRELRNRQLGACEGATRALNTLMGQHVKFDFRMPSDRQRAIEAYATAR